MNHSPHQSVGRYDKVFFAILVKNFSIATDPSPVIRLAQKSKCSCCRPTKVHD